MKSPSEIAIEYTPITWASELEKELFRHLPGASDSLKLKLQNAIAKFFRTHLETWGAMQQVSTTELRDAQDPDGLKEYLEKVCFKHLADAMFLQRDYLGFVEKTWEEMPDKFVSEYRIRVYIPIIPKAKK